jgi:hypothetical protein
MAYRIGKFWAAPRTRVVYVEKFSAQFCWPRREVFLVTHDMWRFLNSWDPKSSKTDRF